MSALNLSEHDDSDEAPVSSSRLREYVPMVLNGFVLTEEEKRLAGAGYELVRVYGPKSDHDRVMADLKTDRKNLETSRYVVAIIEPQDVSQATTALGVKPNLSSSYRVWRKKKSD